ncbi:MAG: TIGR03617 family F420-dependent LLM class oxidoreductase [Chloroflexi bacterium]|nr:TIGR03617 family F420-dependent LLM class oxidoreductase [Chloroflexota bacterium]
MGFKVETGMYAARMEEAGEAARHAEGMGYDSINTAETAHDSFLPLVLAAEHTERIGIGTSVAIAFPRSPMVTAMIAWDLQRYSKGRFTLGLGTQVKGHNQRRFSVPWSPPAPRIKEYVESLKAIWESFQTGGKLDYVGQHYSFTLMTPNFNPGPIDWPRPKVHIAAVNEHNARVAGEVCDGIKLHGFNTMKYTKDVILPQVMKGLEKSGRKREDFEVCGGGFLATGKDWAAVERSVGDVKRQLSFYGSTRTYQNVFDHHGWGDTTARLHEMSLQGKWAEMPSVIPDDMVKEFAVCAPYDKVVAEMKARYSGVCDRVGFGAAGRTPEEQEAARQIIKELKA